MRPVSRDMRLWWGSAAATFGRHRSRANPWSGGSWKGLSIWGRGFSALRSWRPGRSPRARASALRLPWLCASVDATSSESVFLLSVSEETGSFTDRQRRRRTHLPASLVLCRGGGGRACFPAASRGSSDTLTAHPFLRSRNPPSLIEKSWVGSRVVTITRQPLDQPDLQWDHITVVKSLAFTSIDQKTVQYFPI